MDYSRVMIVDPQMRINISTLTISMLSRYFQCLSWIRSNCTDTCMKRWFSKHLSLSLSLSLSPTYINIQSNANFLPLFFFLVKPKPRDPKYCNRLMHFFLFSFLFFSLLICSFFVLLFFSFFSFFYIFSFFCCDVKI